MVIVVLVEVTVPAKLKMSSLPVPSIAICPAFRLPATLSVAPPPLVSAFTSRRAVARLSSVMLATVMSSAAVMPSSTTLALSVTSVSSTFVPAVISFVPVPARSISVTLSLMSIVPLVAVRSTLVASCTSVFTFEIVRSVAASTSPERFTLFAWLIRMDVFEDVTVPSRLNVSFVPEPSTVI